MMKHEQDIIERIINLALDEKMHKAYEEAYHVNSKHSSDTRHSKTVKNRAPMPIIDTQIKCVEPTCT